MHFSVVFSWQLSYLLRPVVSHSYLATGLAFSILIVVGFMIHPLCSTIQQMESRKERLKVEKYCCLRIISGGLWISQAQVSTPH